MFSPSHTYIHIYIALNTKHLVARYYVNTFSTPPNMCTQGYIYYCECRHIYGPTHLPCRAIEQCGGARLDGVDLASKPSQERFVEVTESCPACSIGQHGNAGWGGN